MTNYLIFTIDDDLNVAGALRDLFGQGNVFTDKPSVGPLLRRLWSLYPNGVPRGNRILHVEEYGVVRQRVAKTLARGGYRDIEQYDSREAALEAFDPDIHPVVITDFDLEGHLDGGLRMIEGMMQKEEK
ncbi:hypothetical protein ACFLQN_02255 [Candidatus Aenigmatarchaeota archaeon]